MQRTGADKIISSSSIVQYSLKRLLAFYTLADIQKTVNMLQTLRQTVFILSLLRLARA